MAGDTRPTDFIGDVWGARGGDPAFRGRGGGQIWGERDADVR